MNATTNAPIPSTGARLVKISHNVEIPLILYKGQPVLTFTMIDTVHGRPEGTARYRFRDNKKRFIEGEDFFYVTDSEGLGEIRPSAGAYLKAAANEVTLITESGYLMLVKSFTDDLAWQVQRQLVKVYFRAKQEAQTPQAAEEYITSAQYHEFKHTVYLIGEKFHYKDSAQWGAWATVRKTLGVEAAAKIPAERYEEAKRLLKDIEQAASTFRCAVMDIEKLFFKRRFGGLPPELAALEQQQKQLSLD